MNWVQVRHRYPETNKYVLVFDGKDYWTACYVVPDPKDGWKEKSWWSPNMTDEQCCTCVLPDLKTVTHWAYIPEVPK